MADSTGYWSITYPLPPQWKWLYDLAADIERGVNEAPLPDGRDVWRWEMAARLRRLAREAIFSFSDEDSFTGLETAEEFVDAFNGEDPKNALDMIDRGDDEAVDFFDTLSSRVHCAAHIVRILATGTLDHADIDYVIPDGFPVAKALVDGAAA